MSNEPSPIRLGMTALVGVVALSATPLFAQSDTAPADSSAAPVTIAPPAPAVAPSPAPQAAPVMSTPVVHTAPAATTAEAPAAPAPRAAPVKRSVSTHVARTETHTAAVAPTATPTPAPVPPPPIAAVPVNPPAAAPAAVAPPPAVPVIPPAAQAPAAAPAPAQAQNETLPIAIGAAVLLLVLAGILYALSRRRRRDEDELGEAFTADPAMQADYVAPPAGMMPVAPATSETPAETPTESLPENFDLSQFGPHVRAAYRGPTPDNPSLSLKKRLKRAHFFDQRERMVGARAAAATAREDRPAMFGQDETASDPADQNEPA